VTEVELRPMTTDDVEDAVAVWERSRWDAQPWLEERMNHSHEDNLRYFRTVIAAENAVWLAILGDTVAGLMALGDGQIDQLYIDPPRQGRGVGTALLNLAKKLSPTGLTLYTHQRNERARVFYESRGFRIVRFGTSDPPESEPDVSYAWEPDGRVGPLGATG
jgi:ribosomal protein S18 acetylase RimI-like enzyme